MYLKREVIISIVALCSLLLLSFPILFTRLTSFPIRLWDESMFALGSYEMLQTGDWIVPRIKGEPDLWNSKPPLTNWIQALTIKLIGFSEMAVRIPSAISAFLTSFFIFQFIRKKTETLLAVIAFLVLITSAGFVTFHTARTGDADALLTLFTTLSIISIFDVIYHKKYQSHHIMWFFIFLSFAFLAKSIAAFLFAPAFIFAIVSEKKNGSFALFRNKFFYMGLLLLLFVSLGYLFIRDHHQPGYLDYFIQHDIMRVSNVIEQHEQPFMFYINELSQSRYAPWFVLTTVGIFLSIIKRRNSQWDKIVYYQSILVLSYVLIISISITKLIWYDMLIYPSMALLSAYAIWGILELLKERKKLQIVCVTFIFIIPYHDAFTRSQKNDFKDLNERTEKYLMKCIRQNQNLDNAIVYHSGYDRGILCYQKMFKEKGQNIFIKDQPDFKKNDVIIVSNDSLKSIVETNFSFEVLNVNKLVTTYKIINSSATN